MLVLFHHSVLYAQPIPSITNLSKVYHILMYTVSVFPIYSLLTEERLNSCMHSDHYEPHTEAPCSSNAPLCVYLRGIKMMPLMMLSWSRIVAMLGAVN